MLFSRGVEELTAFHYTTVLTAYEKDRRGNSRQSATGNTLHVTSAYLGAPRIWHTMLLQQQRDWYTGLAPYARRPQILLAVMLGTVATSNARRVENQHDRGGGTI